MRGQGLLGREGSGVVFALGELDGSKKLDMAFSFLLANYLVRSCFVEELLFYFQGWSIIGVQAVCVNS